MKTPATEPLLSHVEGAVLVGGASKRMGRDKATLEVDGVALARRVADALSTCVARVRLVARPDGAPELGYECIPDLAEARAPLVGVHAALEACDAPGGVLVAACDMPSIEPRLLLALLALSPASAQGPDIIAPVGERGPEPLLAIYRPSVLPEVRRRIERDELAMHALLRDANTWLIPEADVRMLDPELRSFQNLNRAEDLS